MGSGLPVITPLSEWLLAQPYALSGHVCPLSRLQALPSPPQENPSLCLKPGSQCRLALSASHPNSVLGQVGRQLALIGDDINRRYDTEFQNLLEQLQPTAANAYELFTKIASRSG